MRKTATWLSVWLIALVALAGCQDRPPETSDTPADPDSEETVDADALSSATWRKFVKYHGAIDAEHQTLAADLIDRGVAYLLNHQNANSAWGLSDSDALEPAVTALAIKAIVQYPAYTADSPELKDPINVLLSYQQADGGIYDLREPAKNYTTSLAVMAMVACDSKEMETPLRNAVKFLRGLQIVPGSESPDGKTITEDDPFIGGVSYGRHGRPDMSNVGMWMEAMHEAGVSPDDPAMQEALAFIARTQNRSESNTSAWAKVGPNDGGFVYAPAVAGGPAAGESKAGAGPGGAGLRSYGTMTYVGFKSMLYADVARDDPRVRAAFDWIRHYWRLDSNPNMPAAQSLEGLYYYYYVFAKALAAWGEPVITDTEGADHNWRHELIDALAERVSEDGSWVNTEARWMEDQPALVTAYAIIALQEAVRP